MSKVDRPTDTPATWAKHLRPDGKRNFNKKVRQKSKTELKSPQRSDWKLLRHPVMNKPALIVIDMLNEFLDRWSAADRQRLIASTLELLGTMRSRKLPVIWVRQEFEANLSDAFLEMRRKGIRSTIQGTPGCEIVPELKPTANDQVVVKKRYSAFFRTELDELLSELQADTLILAGVNTHACIRTTAIDAYQRDWPVILAVDCIDSYDKEHHEVSLRYMRDKIARVMTNAQIIETIGDTPIAGRANAIH